MPLSGTVEAAPDGALGFDVNTPISLAIAQQFAAQDYTFCIRYLSRGSFEASRDLTAAEASTILSAGLCLIAVQHVSMPGWSPTMELGEAYGTNAADHAAEIGFPEGVNVWCDLEGVLAGTPAQDVIDYCKAWFDAVDEAGYVPGIYVGADAILNAQQLYDLPFEHYWRSISNVPEIPVRGYQMIQTPVKGNINGVSIDRNQTRTDAKDGQVLWLAPA